MKLNRHAWLLGALLATSCALRPPGLTPPSPVAGLAPDTPGLAPDGMPDFEQQGLSERNEVIVRFKPGSEGKDIGVPLVRELLLPRTKLFKVDSLEAQAALLRQLREDPDVEYAEPDYTVHAAALPSDPKLGDLWAFTKVNMAGAWGTTLGDAAVKIAVIDTGVNYKHPDLADNCLVAEGFDFQNYDTDPMDDEGHGTHVAGTIAAIANAQGVVGAAPGCKIIPIKALGLKGGASSAVASAIVHAVQKGAKVINLSLGSTTATQTERNAVDYAVGQGVIVVAAAGNSNTTRPSYPAGYPSAISVGATDRDDKRASFSNYGPWVKLAAPGTEILSTDYFSSSTSGNYSIKQGTSMASPLVAGVAALMRSQHADWTVQEIQQALVTTGVALPVPFYTDKTGPSGIKRLDANAALALSSPPSDPAPTIKLLQAVPALGGATLRLEASEPVSVAVEVSESVDFADSRTFNGPSSKASLPVVALDDLKAGTTYYYRVKATDPKGQEASETGLTAPRTLKTLPITYTGISVSGVPVAPGSKVADVYKMLVRWKSSRPTTSKIELSFSPDMSSSGVITDSNRVSDHALTLGSTTPLYPGKKYYYRLSGDDSLGNAVVSPTVGTFTTYPVSYSVKASYTRTSINLEWTSGVALNTWAATASTAAGLPEPEDGSERQTTHAKTFEGLAPGKTYYVRIGGYDANGYPVTLRVFTVPTAR
ncbi:MAG TPA: S8 family serine peptidase [Pantanalinema sp.]